MNKDQLGGGTVLAVKAFCLSSRVAPRARFLLVYMLDKGLVTAKGGVWDGGVARLASSFGCSPGGISSSLQKLVSLGFLVKGRSLTKGRPVDTYVVGPKLAGGLPLGPFQSRTLARVLCVQDGVLTQLSATERCMMGQLWLALLNGGEHMFGLDKYKACALMGVSILDLARECGISRLTAKRALVELEKRSLIEIFGSDVMAAGIAGITKTYFLLGPAMLENVKRVQSFVVDRNEIPVWPARCVEDSDFKSLIEEMYDLEIDEEGRVGELVSRLKKLNSSLLRNYIFFTICASLSNAFIWVEGNKFSAIKRIEEVLLRCLGLQRSGPGMVHFGIDRMNDFQGEESLYECVEFLSARILEGFTFALFRELARVRGRVISPFYVSCCPVESDDGFFVRVDVVYL